MENNKQKLTAEGILQYIRTHNVSYAVAEQALDCAKQLLRAMVVEELNYLAMADGIGDKFDIDKIKLTAKGYPQNY